ncbi:O-antigen/teichoic acid export membrane protein [Bradyrhizobium sp. USDA 4354]
MMPQIRRAFDQAPSLINAGLRACAIVLRFSLIIFITREAGLEGIGVYGVVQSLIAPSPAALGLGINYFWGRNLVHASLSEASLAIRDRMILSLLVCSVISLIVFSSASWIDVRFSGLLPEIIGLCFLEVIGKDIHVGLNAVRHSRTANLLYFIRSSAWVPLVLAGHFGFGWFFSLKIIFDLWIGCTIASYLGVLALLLNWNSDLIRTRPRLGSYLTIARKGWYIYLNEVVHAIASNLDRYIIASVLGLREVGIYSFFWAFSNTVLTLVDAGVVQTEWPELVRARRSAGSHSDWSKLARRYVCRVAVFAFCLCSLATIAAYFSALSVKGNEVRPYLWLSVAMASCQWVAVLSVAMNAVLASARDDKFVAASNLTFFPIYIAFLPVAAVFGSLPGVMIFISALTVVFLLIRTKRVVLLIRAASSSAAPQRA